MRDVDQRVELRAAAGSAPGDSGERPIDAVENLEQKGGGEDQEPRPPCSGEGGQERQGKRYDAPGPAYRIGWNMQPCQQPDDAKGRRAVKRHHHPVPPQFLGELVFAKVADNIRHARRAACGQPCLRFLAKAPLFATCRAPVHFAFFRRSVVCMGEITAVILAAGRGIRMGTRGRSSPKGLLGFGERSFVEQSVRSLLAAGVGRVRLVTGHLAEAYRENAALNALGVDLCHNPDYAGSGSLQSLLVGIEGLDGPCLVLESDLIYEPRALRIASEDRSLVLVSGPTGAGDEVYVWTGGGDGGHGLRGISKNRRAFAEAPFGELVGITMLAAPAVLALQRSGWEWRGPDGQADYESGLVRLGQEVPVACDRIEDLAWAEIDDEAMFRRAAELVHPRIRAAREAAGLKF